MAEQNDFIWARSNLRPDEYILWKGKPQPGHLLTGADTFMIPFSIFWCGFAIFWETMAIGSGAPLFFCLFGVPFILVGLYITVGRFFHRAYLLKHTEYVITSKRILRMRGRRMDSITGAAMFNMSVITRRDGSGTITFGQMNPYMRGGRDWNGENYRFTLENVEDVYRVQQIIQSIER